MSFDLAAAARRQMIEHGFEPDPAAVAVQQARTLRPRPQTRLEDLTALPWSSIDNDESRDLDRAPGENSVNSPAHLLAGCELHA